MQNEFKQVLFMSGLMLASAALAEPTAEDLTKIEAETTVLKAQAKKLEVRAQIVSRQAEIATKQAEVERLAAPSTFGDPAIRAIEGVGKSVTATLQLDNGSAMEVRVGDMLPNGMKVVSIQPNEVVVETGKKKRVRLGYAAAQPSGPTMFPAAPNFVGALPAPGLPGRGVPGR